MKVISICLYCNKNETFYSYDASSVASHKCPDCGDRKKKIVKQDRGNVFGYPSVESKKDDHYYGND